MDFVDCLFHLSDVIRFQRSSLKGLASLYHSLYSALPGGVAGIDHVIMWATMMGLTLGTGGGSKYGGMLGSATER